MNGFWKKYGQTVGIILVILAAAWGGNNNYIILQQEVKHLKKEYVEQKCVNKTLSKEINLLTIEVAKVNVHLENLGK